MDVISYYVSCESGNDRVIFQFQRKIYDCHRCAILWGFDIPTDSTLESEKKIPRKTKLDLMCFLRHSNPVHCDLLVKVVSLILNDLYTIK